MSKKKVRKIFISILIFLPLQYILVGIVGHFKAEPWPAFVFPGFKNVYVSQDLYKIPQIYFEVYNNNSDKTGTFKPYQFFPDLPRSQISGFMRTRFQDKYSIESLSDEARSSLNKNSMLLTDGDPEYVKVISTVEYYRRTDNGLEIDSTDHQFTAVIQLDDR